MRISKNEKGITLVALTITIIVLMIVTSITIVNMESSMKIKRVDKLYNDISNLKTKIDSYYVEHNELPVLEQYCESKDDLKSILELNGVSNVQLDENDDEYYYVIDLSKIEGLTLSYGKDYGTDDLTTNKGEKDLYIINNRSHQIYYPKTVSFNKKHYYSYLSSDKTIIIGNINSEAGEFAVENSVEKMKYSILAGTKVKLIANIIINDTDREKCNYQFAWSNNSENATNYKDFPSVTDWSQMISLESEKLGAGNYWLFIKKINEVGNEKITKVNFNNEGEAIVIEEEAIVLSVLNSNEKVGVKVSYNNVQIEDLKYGTGTSVEEAKGKLSKFPKNLIDENSDENITEYSIMEEDGIDLTKYLYVQGKEKDKENITSAYIYLLQEANSVDSETSMYNCLNTEIVDGKIYGNTVQETRSGKNLFNINEIKNSSNINVVNNQIKLSGYANSTGITPEMFLSMTGLKEGETVTVSYSQENVKGTGTVATGTLRFYLKNSNNTQGFFLSSNKTVSIPENFNSDNYGMLIMYGNNVSDDNGEREYILSNIQIERGTVATEYEEYGTSPSLEYSSEIQSVGDKTSNLFDMDTVLLEHGWLKQEDGSYYIGNNSSITGKKLWENTEGYTGQIKIDYQAKYLNDNDESIGVGTIISVVYKSGIAKNVAFVDGKWTKEWRSSDWNNVSDAGQIVDYVTWIYGTGSNSTWIKDIMITKDVSSTEYEPYGKYKIPVNIEGKNLFNINKTDKNMTSLGYIEIVESGYNILNKASFSNGGSIGIFSTLVPNLKVGDKFKVDFETNAIRDDKDVNYIYLNLYKNTLRKGIEYTATQEMLDSKMYIYSGGTENCYYKNIMIYPSEYTSEFEAYVEPVVTNIYLNEPLRKVGDSADYIDFKNKEVVRLIGAKTTNFKFWSYQEENNYLYLVSSRFNDKISGDILGMSNKIKKFKIFPGSAEDNALMCSGQDYYYLVKAAKEDQEKYIEKLKDTEILYRLNGQAKEEIKIPDIILTSKTSILRVNTEIKPSYIECKYFSNTD